MIPAHHAEDGSREILYSHDIYIPDVLGLVLVGVEPGCPASYSIYGWGLLDHLKVRPELEVVVLAMIMGLQVSLGGVLVLMVMVVVGMFVCTEHGRYGAQEQQQWQQGHGALHDDCGFWNFKRLYS
ncbi:hypothetical protein F751_3370 [Auxenochlorella protothecoides]|uniref:Uncharacterized protein n=1 Tax=Auxenochlorella protothecoides TaxID=3075 RepID=A0A087SBS5_AUXPR|nr:hypothetical protein F751_3370 [Auxenochlorella protothecoides]KFM23179.1 hypothetical protein F751_3370 [Auxenochlorella protothecoides]